MSEQAIVSIVSNLTYITVAISAFLVIRMFVKTGRQLKAKHGSSSVEINGSCGEIDIRAIHSLNIVHESKKESRDSAWSEQRSLAMKMEERFMTIFLPFAPDEWHLDAPWLRMLAILESAADRNHIMSYVTGKRVDHDYIMEKLKDYETTYNLVRRRSNSTLPEFDDIKHETYLFIEQVLVEFGKIANQQAERFRLFKEKLSSSIDNTQVIQILNEIELWP